MDKKGPKRTRPRLVKALLEFEDALQELKARQDQQDSIQGLLDRLMDRRALLLQHPNPDSNTTSKADLLRTDIIRRKDALRNARRAVRDANTNYATAFAACEEIFFHLTGSMDDLRRDNALYARKEEALNRTLDAMLKRRIDAVLPDLEPATFQNPEGAYGYISIGIPRFYTQLVLLDRALATDPDYAVDGARYRPVNFLEIGCGTGRNILLAKTCEVVRFASLSGFDINPVNLAVGKAAFGLEDALFVDDALNFDYGGHDILFSYRPFSDFNLQSQLEARIVHTMRKGAYFLAPFAVNLGKFPDLSPVGISTEIWKKTG